MNKKFELVEFDWDLGNRSKNSEKHGITASESEEIFLDEKSVIIRDIKHSQQEDRFMVIGQTFFKELLFVVFTLRKNKIRIVSARKANKNEKNAYKKGER
ncbi:MAG: BrnT family toxin [Patescibacteria group bacterium]